MPKTPKVVIPQRAIPILKWFAELSTEQYGALREALSIDKQSVSRTELGNRLQEAAPDAPLGRGADLVVEVFSLIRVRAAHGWNLAETAEQVGHDKSLSLGDREQAALASRLAEVMGNPVVTRLAKAYDLYSEHANLFHTARIITDARPIFEGDETESITGILITHTLKLNYHAPEGTREIFIALDLADLETLERAVSTARSQAESLGNLITSSGLVDLTIRND